MVVLIVLEAIINHLYRGRPHNLADSVTNVSSGLLMTAGGLVTRVAMVSTYDHIYQVPGTRDRHCDPTSDTGAQITGPGLGLRPHLAGDGAAAGPGLLLVPPRQSRGRRVVGGAPGQAPGLMAV